MRGVIGMRGRGKTVSWPRIVTPVRIGPVQAVPPLTDVQGTPPAIALGRTKGACMPDQGDTYGPKRPGNPGMPPKPPRPKPKRGS